VRIALLEDGRKTVTLLDGDEVRQHLSTELGFSKEHRELNIRRIAYVASEITKARGVAICSAIAPYRAPREFSRSLISKYGGFFEIHISTPLEVCESRDRKGLYRKARQGLIKGFTGIDDPYEVPTAPELEIDTSQVTVRQAVQQIILMLEQEGFLTSGATPAFQQ
jgi:sulfate adenylyltransferase